MDKIVILASPIAPTQQIFVYHNGEITDHIGAPADHLTDVIPAIMETTGIYHIEISGNHVYTLGIQEQLTHIIRTEFDFIEDFTIVCI